MPETDYERGELMMADPCLKVWKRGHGWAWKNRLSEPEIRQLEKHYGKVRVRHWLKDYSLESDFLKLMLSKCPKR